jgi:hypothetical protein
MIAGPSGQDEDAGADDRADAQADQVDRAERPLQLAAGRLLLDVGDGFLDQQPRAGRPD